MHNLTDWEVSHLLKRVRGFSEKADKIYLTFEELEALEKKTFPDLLWTTPVIG
jgi:hypothetical protein